MWLVWNSFNLRDTVAMEVRYYGERVQLFCVVRSKGERVLYLTKCHQMEDLRDGGGGLDLLPDFYSSGKVRLRVHYHGDMMMHHS